MSDRVRANKRAEEQMDQYSMYSSVSTHSAPPPIAPIAPFGWSICSLAVYLPHTAHSGIKLYEIDAFNSKN